MCALCGEDTRQSHIVSKVFGENKRSSPTDNVSANPAERGRDTEKARTLCDRCKARLSKHETWFADNIFRPFNSGTRTFEYDRNLGLFATWLGWRALKSSYDEFKASSNHLVPLIDDAERCWRDVLLGKRQASPYESHLLFLGDAENLSDGDDRRRFRAVDATLCASGSRVFAYTKMPRMLAVSSIFPLNMEGWRGTLIKTGGKTTTSQTVDDAGFRRFYRDRAHAALACPLGPSDEQARTGLEKALKDPPRVLKSQTRQIWRKEAGDLEKVGGLPPAVRELIERVITGAVAGPEAREYGREASWASRHVAGRLAGLSRDEACELGRAIAEAADESARTGKCARRAWRTDSLRIVFMARRGATRERQHSEIRRELEDLRRRTPSRIPIGVFSMNGGDGGCSFESGFSVRPPELSR